jgi:uncharacterized repeat protein (TIGR03803 family)
MKHLCLQLAAAFTAAASSRRLVALALLCAAPASAGEFHYIYLFRAAPDAANPQAGLAIDPQGNLYGTSYGGGTSNVGSVFRLTPPAQDQGKWSEEILASFGGTTIPFPGYHVSAPVTLGSDGSVYGGTSQGGINDRGIVFELSNTAGWPLTVLHSFTTVEGNGPNAALLFGPDGLLYGSTPTFGSYGSGLTGSDFSLSPLGDQVEFRVLHDFGKPGDGANPAGLTLAPASLVNGFIGATITTPTNSPYSGTVYALNIFPGGAANETVLYTFGPNPDVSDPTLPPIVGKFALKNLILGCGAGGGAPGGGAHGRGGIYQLAPNGAGGFTESVLYSFGAQPNDPEPGNFNEGTCSLIQGNSAGTLYGTTTYGGAYNGGALFELDPPATQGAAWTEKVDVSFNPKASQGAWYPLGALLLHGAALYGTLSTSPNGAGGVYAYVP